MCSAEVVSRWYGSRPRIAATMTPTTNGHAGGHGHGYGHAGRDTADSERGGRRVAAGASLL